MMARQLAEGYLDRRYLIPRKAGTTAREFDDDALAFMSDRGCQSLFEDMARDRSDDEGSEESEAEEESTFEAEESEAEESDSEESWAVEEDSTFEEAGKAEKSEAVEKDSTFEEAGEAEESEAVENDGTVEAEEEGESEVSDPGEKFMERYAPVYEREGGSGFREEAHAGDRAGALGPQHREGGSAVREAVQLRSPAVRVEGDLEKRGAGHRGRMHGAGALGSQHREGGRGAREEVRCDDNEHHPRTPGRRVPAQRPTSTSSPASPTPRKVATNVRKYASVKRGAASHTPGGLTADDIIVSSSAKKYVSKRLSATSKARYEGSLMQLFAHSREAVRREFGNAPCGGKTLAGQAFLAAARAEYQLRLLNRPGEDA